MKICLHIIWVLPHSDIKFYRKNQFCKYIKNCRKISKKWVKPFNLPDFRIIFNIYAKLIFALKFDIYVLTQPNNMHKNFHKVIITRQKMTVMAKLQFCNFVQIFVAAREILWDIERM